MKAERAYFFFAVFALFLGWRRGFVAFLVSTALAPSPPNVIVTRFSPTLLIRNFPVPAESK